MENKYDEFGPAVEDYSSFGDSVESAPNEVYQEKIKQPNLLEEFGKANEIVTNTIRKPFIGSDNGKPRSFAETYSQNVMNVLEKTSLRNHPNLEYLAYGTVGKAAGLAGLAVDTATNPKDVATGAALGIATKVIGPLENAMAQTTNKVLSKFGINLGNKAEARIIAEQANTALKAAERAFSKSYDELLSKTGNKIVPDAYKQQIMAKVSKITDSLSPTDPAFEFFDKGFKGMLESPNLNVNALHAMKQDIYKKVGGAGTDLYNTVSNILGSKKLAGESYTNLSREYGKFMNEEANYVKDKILDKFDNVSYQKLMSSRLGGLVKTPIKLQENYRYAFEKLQGRPTTKTDILGQLDALRKGTIIKRVVGAALTAGATAVFPQTRKVINSAAHILG